MPPKKSSTPQINPIGTFAQSTKKNASGSTIKKNSASGSTRRNNGGPGSTRKKSGAYGSSINTSVPYVRAPDFTDFISSVDISLLSIEKLLADLNINLSKLLGIYKFEVKDEGKKPHEAYINFMKDLQYLNTPGILYTLVKEAYGYINKVNKENIVIIDGENLLYECNSTVYDIKMNARLYARDLILDLIQKNYFVFILRHTKTKTKMPNILEWECVKKPPKPQGIKKVKESMIKKQSTFEGKYPPIDGLTRDLLHRHMIEINKGISGSMLDDFFVVLLSVIAHKSTKYGVPKFLTKLTNLEFPNSFEVMDDFQKGSDFMDNNNKRQKFKNNLANKTIQHPNNLILSLDKFKWLEIATESVLLVESVLPARNGKGSVTAGPAGAAAPAGAARSAGAAISAGPTGPTAAPAPLKKKTKRKKKKGSVVAPNVEE